MTCTPILTGDLFRTGDEALDMNGERVAPQDLFQFTALNDEAEARGQAYVKWRACSADWSEHGACGGAKGAAARAAEAGRLKVVVFAISCTNACAPIKVGPRIITLITMHWPEDGNEAHSHIMMDPKVNRTERSNVRDLLRLRAVPR
jgi:hypothetical protein